MTRKTLYERERAQRVEIAAAVAADRPALQLTAELEAEPIPSLAERARSLRVVTVGELDPEATSGHVVVDVEGVLAAEPVVVASALARCAEAGASVVATMPGGLEPLVLPRFRGAAVLRQHAVEVSVLAADGASLPAPPELTLDGVGSRWTIVVVGAELPAGVAYATQAAGAVQRERIDALERANAELRRANARLAAGAGSSESGREAHEELMLRTLRRERDELLLQLDELRRRYDDAVEAARQNDELFQDARRWLEIRDEEIRSLRATLDATPHRVAAGVAYRARKLRRRGRRKAG